MSRDKPGSGRRLLVKSKPSSFKKGPIRAQSKGNHARRGPETPYDANVRPVFDTRDADALSAFGMTPNDLADAAWRDKMIARGESGTQNFARRLFAEGYAALLVRSFARGASNKALNLVLWRWSSAPPTKLVLIDDDNRLSGDPDDAAPEIGSGSFSLGRRWREAPDEGTRRRAIGR